MNKKVFISVLTTLFAVSILFGTAYASGVITLTINGKKVSTDVAPQMIKGRVMVPLSVISKELGADISWNQKTNAVTVKSFGVPYEDVWKESMNSVSEFVIADINNTVQVFMTGMDRGDIDLLNKTVTPEMDVEYLSLLHFSMGATMLSMKIVDMKPLESETRGEIKLRQYLVRVAVQTWLEKTTIDYWDLTLVENSQYNSERMPYLVKEQSIVKSVEVDELKVFPGYTYKMK